jgi:hypothetical protein
MGQSTEELRRDIENTRGHLGETLEAIGDRVSPARVVERRKNRMMNTARSVRERVMGTASETGRAIGDTAGGAIDTLTGTPDAIRQQAQGSPLVAGAIAFGVGLLAASVARPSAIERRAADQLIDKVDPLKDELKHAGQEMVEHMQQPVREAVEQVKETASEGSHTVADAAKEVASTSRQAVTDAADTVRSEATERA